MATGLQLGSVRVPTLDDLDELLSKLTELQKDSTFEKQQRFIHNKLLETAGGALFTIIRQHHTLPNSDFYYWPGYASILSPVKESRITLFDETTRIQTGIGYQVLPNGVQPPYKMNRSALWFSRVLTQHDASLEPGSTHRWLMDPDLRLIDDKGDETRLKFLHVAATASPLSVSHVGGLLSVHLNANRPNCYGRQLACALNKQKVIKTTSRWPFASQEDGRTHKLRILLYDIWLGATFSTTWFQEPGLLNNLVSQLKAFGAPNIAEAVGQPDPPQGTLPENEYSHWYSLAILLGQEELGTAMLFTSHELSSKCIGECRSFLTNFYRSWRVAEDILQRRPSGGSLIDAFLDQSSYLTHHDCQSGTDKALNALATLLSFSATELVEHFEEETRIQFLDAMKSLGIQAQTGTSRSAISAPGAWLVALGAYRALWPHARWQNIFEVSQLQRDLRGRLITPAQSPQRLQRTIRSLFEMYQRLFEAHDPIAMSNSPVRKVSLSHSGLSFTLGFDCMSDQDGSSLVEKLNECCESTIHAESRVKNKTSLAIWNFILHTYFSDSGNISRDGLWGGYWRLNIRPHGRGTTLIYFR
jgi:hypothetical protein